MVYTYYIASKHFYTNGKYVRINKVMEAVAQGAELRTYPNDPSVIPNLLFSWVRASNTPKELERRHLIANKNPEYIKAFLKNKPSNNANREN